MKRLWMVMTSAVVVVAGCASTQSPSIGVTPRPGVDTTPRNTVEVLRADEKMVTRVEKPNKVSPAPEPIRLAQADSDSGKKMGNGWVITVYPWRQEAMVGRFVQPTPSPIKFEGHETLIPKGTPVTFKGESIFVANKPGNHVFIIRISSRSDRDYFEYIFGNFAINDKKIININDRDHWYRNMWFETDGKYTASATKSIKLGEGEYNISFEFGAREKYWYPDLYTMEILVIEPGGSQPMHLTPQQVIHYRN